MTARTIKCLLMMMGAGVFAACAGSEIAGVRQVASTAAGDRTLLGVLPKLVKCPTSDAVSSTAEITPLGGIVSAGGTTISIPAGALTETATITVTVPASIYMEVDVSVAGVDHYLFEAPVTVSLNYARCDRSNILHSPNTAWYIDSDTKALLQLMPGVDDPFTRTVTFTTGHLSGYALAN